MAETIPLPKTINVLGVTYTVTYVDRPSDVDIFGRNGRWGETDYWTRTIRIYKDKRPPEDIWGTVIHETFHALEEALHLDVFKKRHNELDTLAIALVDVFMRNGWLRVSGGGGETSERTPSGISGRND